ncbi:MAG: hypothetical protein AAFR54_07445 [Planctomycetota bacterium]
MLSLRFPPLVLTAALFGVAAGSAVSPSTEELVSAKARKPLYVVSGEVARLGRSDIVEDLHRVLRDLGAPEKEAEPWIRKTTRSLERAKSDPKERAIRSCAKRLERAIDGLTSQFVQLDDEATARLAGLVLELDSENAAAHAALGYERLDGVYMTVEQAQFAKRARELETALAEAMSMELAVDVTSPSTSPMMLHVYGEASHTISCHGIVVHGGVDATRLERALRQAIRGLAFTHWVMTGELAVPKFPKPVNISFTSNEPDYARVADEAAERGWINEEMRQRIEALDLGSFFNGKGERCSRWRPEARISALIHWDVVGDLYPKMLPTLLAGHVNWVSLRIFGTGKPSALIRKEGKADRESSAKARIRTDTLWHAANSGMFGARSWIQLQLSNGRSMSFNRALRDQEGKIGGEELLIATVATEYLQTAGRFAAAGKYEPEKDSTVHGAIEAALDQSIPEFDAAWLAPFEEDGSTHGVLQRLLPEAAEDERVASASNDVVAAVAYLTAIREKALGSLGVYVETVAPVQELCDQNALHAAYLNLHPEQKAAWPDAHEEYPDKEGFTPEGVWGGLHSVIAFTGDAERAIDDWMGAFFHRLPLLEPGLCGTGLAINEDVVVLDVASLRNQYFGEALVAWPYEGMTDVPCCFTPEVPNPVPGEDQGRFGYPFTVQAYWGVEPNAHTLELEMFVEDELDPVACHVITPEAPLFDRLTPGNAYCLIPKRPLRKNTGYRVVGREVETGEATEWRFSTGGS